LSQLSTTIAHIRNVTAIITMPNLQPKPQILQIFKNAIQNFKLSCMYRTVLFVHMHI